MKWRNKRQFRSLLTVACVSLLILILIVDILYIRSYTLKKVPDYSFDILSTERNKITFQLHEYTILKPSFQSKCKLYLTILQGSIDIIRLPSQFREEVIHRCRTIPSRGPLDNHQHSVEIHFPRILVAMSTSSISDFRPLTRSTNHSHIALAYAQASTEATTFLQNTLFYMIEAYVYHTIYCTNKKNNKEKWEERDPYWLQVADFMLSVPSYSKNTGLDHFAVASHPQSHPTRIHPYSLSYLHRISFLRTDFDLSGCGPKDILVPYVTESMQQILSNTSIDSRLLRNSKPLVSARSDYTFLFFNGGDNPHSGYRFKFVTKMNELLQSTYVKNSKRLELSSIHVSLDPLPTEQYLQTMLKSTFCLCIRGDTKSSRRFFTSIAVGCIPVIIGDWIELPFQSFIDYRKFTIKFPESIIHDQVGLLEYLLLLPPTTVSNMKESVLEAKDLLLYPKLHEVNQPRDFPTLNPVTLTLMELLDRRLMYCAEGAITRFNSFCQALSKRMNAST